ncbi:40S ribosomal protein S1, variant 2 [Pleodorina starrii]|uniref:40S ribosomal protein S1, variant 2 n=1 Tax=Pleodorina starrii TaxID=330485 RepID=A0A9W6BQ41_9CHLO|nr:40S ribosomal protein S1 [Pleodorina starrii]GLC56239.1 40S ribosomal protein S1, variant 2 [Pleodorina starrii]GLC69127.1 40S ribosomal protein S1 [Pleodorina starrii]
MVNAKAQQQLYTHAAEPKAVQQRRAKYREDEGEPLPTANIMFDRRVVRGNTYAARILPADVTQTQAKPSPPATRKKTTRTVPPRTPEAVEGRRHIDIQTDVYLEELTDTVPEADTFTQTDAFLDRPPTPLFVPQKTGTDAVTQIENGDLFDFDFEVEPILEVLVGKVLEQGLMEVLEEEELAAMRAHQEQFEQIRNAELVATQRMEAAERRKLEEKDRRMAQERERVERERVVRQKVAASAFARGYLSGIVNTVFDRLVSSGYIYDPVMREVETGFMPWLKEQAIGYLARGVVARQVVNKLVEDAAAALSANRDAVAEKAAATAAAVDAWAERQAALETKLQGAELEAVRSRPTFVLRELKPATPEAIEAAAAELRAQAEEAANAKYENDKAEAAEKARAEAEEKAEAQRVQLEELAAQAAAEAEERGEDPPEEPPTLDEPLVDVEAVVEAAVAAVVKPPVKEVEDIDIISYMLDQGIITKDAIIQSLAVHALGDKGYIHHPAFAETA